MSDTERVQCILAVFIFDNFKVHKVSCLLVFVHKGLLKHSHTHSFSVCGCFLDTMEELNNCHRDCMAHKAKNILYLSLYRKNLPTSVLEAPRANTIYWLKGHTLTLALPISTAFLQIWEFQKIPQYSFQQITLPDTQNGLGRRCFPNPELCLQRVCPLKFSLLIGL